MMTTRFIVSVYADSRLVGRPRTAIEFALRFRRIGQRVWAGTTIENDHLGLYWALSGKVRIVFLIKEILPEARQRNMLLGP